MKVAVVGVGLIGGSIGLAARQRLGAHVSGYDPSAAARETAIARGAVLEAHDTVAAAVDGADFAFVAAPVQSLAEMVATALDAAGADGIIVEVHPNPEEAICDGPQQIFTESFPAYLEQVERAAAVAGKVLSAAA